MDEAPKRKSRKQEMIPGIMTWQLLERIFNNYKLWESYYQETLNGDLYINGMNINFFDLLRGIEDLPTRQKQALVLTCLENHKEADAAQIMGFTRWSSQVGMYKRKALKTLCDNIWNKEDHSE